MESISIPNTAYMVCADTVKSWSDSTTLKSQHNWGHVFKAGVSYTETAKAEFEGFGVDSPVTFSVEESLSTGGFKEIDQTITSTETCTAKPMTRVDCKYMAYKGTIEVGYTIYWKNSTPTRGVYKGEGWKSTVATTVTSL